MSQNASGKASDSSTDLDKNVVHTGDCFEVLESLPAESIHAVVTDPPYGLAFMGRDWDDFEPKEYQEWCEQWATEVRRVLKPGGHLLAFSGNRTHHRMFVGVEDAGFEIRDTLTWHYGSGFPKASDVSKVIDKRADAEREVVGTKEKLQSFDSEMNNTYGDAPDREGVQQITEPATDAAQQWDGWKTGLKPATEFVVVARKPFDGATVDCVLEHGTGALNIDGCRIEGGERPDRGGENNGSDSVFGQVQGSNYATGTTTEGRYPANVVFGEQAADALDAEVGELSGGDYRPPQERNRKRHFDEVDEEQGNFTGKSNAPDNYGDEGGPSRYFYTSKATKAERTLDGKIDNAHPTVKPQDLMEWLVKLVTAEEQVVIDPFAGSGTTLKAAKDLNRQFVGIEKQAQWADVARVRAGLTPNDPSHVRDTDDAQSGLETYQ
jgi:site-specific DNA-methyltransferase (adenine-specific)